MFRLFLLPFDNYLFRRRAQSDHPNTLHASNRLIDSYRFFYEKSGYWSGFLKAYLLNYYGAHWKTDHCKYMLQKTIAFWAMFCNNLSVVKDAKFILRVSKVICLFSYCKLRTLWSLQIISFFFLALYRAANNFIPVFGAKMFPINTGLGSLGWQRKEFYQALYWTTFR